MTSTETGSVAPALSRPPALHASRQPLIGLSSRVTSGGRARLVF